MAKRCSPKGCSYPRSRYWKKSLSVDWFDHNNEESDLLFWMPNDAHVKRDKDNGRDSIADAVTHISAVESRIDFVWTLSDLSGNNNDDKTPLDNERPEILTQLSGLSAPVKIMNGNHDTGNADGAESGLEWFNALMSEIETQNGAFPFTLLSGSTNQTYAWTVGNALFIVAGDYNNGPDTEGGRGDSPTAESGYPTGGISTTAWAQIWEWRFLHLDKICLLNTHQALIRDTTLVSGWQDSSHLTLHGSDPDYPGGEGYVLFIGTDRGSDNQGTRKPFDLFSKSNALVDFIVHGHSHPKLNSSLGGKTHVKQDFFGGVTMLNNACLTYYWANSGQEPDPNSWFGRLSGSTLNLKRMIHRSPNTLSATAGEYYAPHELNIDLTQTFTRSYSEPTPSAPNAATNLAFSRVMSNMVRLTWDEPSGGADGYLVIRRNGAAPTGTPSDDTVYLIGDSLGDGTVVSIGNKRDIEDTTVTNSTTAHYAIFAFNSGGGSIKYASSLTGNQAIAQGTVYLYEDFSQNIFNPYKLVSVKEDRGDGVYHFWDGGYLNFRGAAFNSGIVEALNNVAYSVNGKTSAGEVWGGGYLEVQNGNSGVGTNMFTTICLWNNGSTIEKGSRNVARVVYGGGALEGDRGEHGIRLQIINAGVLRYSFSVAYEATWWKIYYNTTTTTTRFYKWNGSAWEQVGTDQVWGLNAAALDFRLYAGNETETTTTDGTQSRVTDLVLSGADYSGKMP